MSRLAQLRLSPVNHLITNWCSGGQPFRKDCCPPKPTCPQIHHEHLPCDVVPVERGMVTYDWLKFMSEVIIGIDNPEEEIAASYIREAAIDFAATAKILQREAVVEVVPGVTTYPVFSQDFERVAGILGVMCEDRSYGCSNFCSGVTQEGIRYHFDAAHQELTVDCRVAVTGHRRYLKILFYAVPTEDACQYDSFLYENFRAGITKVARRRYVMAMHFRDRELVRSLPSEADVNAEMIRAKTASMRAHTFGSKMPTLFGGRR